MCTDRRRAKRAALAMSGALALVFGLVVAGAPVASADEEAEPSTAERIAEALEESPVYVDPAYASALPEERREAVVERIRASGAPVYVLLVPLLSSDAWQGDPQNLVAAVHDRMGVGQAHYLALSDSRLFGQDIPHNTGEEGPSAHYGALATSYETDFGEDVAAQVERAVEITVSDSPEQEYSRAVEEYSERSGASSGPLARWWPAVAVVVVAVAAATGLLLYLRRSRRTSDRGRDRVSALPQHAAFDNADRARMDELDTQVREELVDVGERLSTLSTGERGGAAATAALRRALDARAAAERAHDVSGDGHADLADLAGALVLLDMAEDAMAEARALEAGRTPPGPRAHCYANPLHGTDAKTTEWRAVGSRRSIQVPLCAACARAVRSRMQPKALPVEHAGREVPYYEVPAAESVWSATGFGALRGDLVDRVTRGDLNPRV